MSVWQDKHPEIKVFLGEIAPHDPRTGVCVICGKRVDTDDFKDEVSVDEYAISGMCQECQDEFFEGE